MKFTLFTYRANFEKSVYRQFRLICKLWWWKILVKHYQHIISQQQSLGNDIPITSVRRAHILLSLGIGLMHLEGLDYQDKWLIDFHKIQLHLKKLEGESL